MIVKNFRKVILVISLSIFAILIISSCRSSEQSPNTDRQGQVIEAYKKFYAAVKSKDAEQIKQMMSKNSLSFAEFAASQQKKPLEEVLKNGFTATTFSETLPEIRDERIKDNFGAVEVWNAQDQRWEDLPFIWENGSWKFAMGDDFKGSFKSPGKGLARREQEASNANGSNMIPIPPPSNVNAANNTKIIKPVRRDNANK